MRATTATAIYVVFVVLGPQKYPKWPFLTIYPKQVFFKTYLAIFRVRHSQKTKMSWTLGENGWTLYFTYWADQFEPYSLPENVTAVAKNPPSMAFCGLRWPYLAIRTLDSPNRVDNWVNMANIVFHIWGGQKLSPGARLTVLSIL